LAILLPVTCKFVDAAFKPLNAVAKPMLHPQL
jgi:hypothetical protein